MNGTESSEKCVFDHDDQITCMYQNPTQQTKTYNGWCFLSLPNGVCYVRIKNQFIV